MTKRDWFLVLIATFAVGFIIGMSVAVEVFEGAMQ